MRVDKVVVPPRIVLAGAPASGKGAHCQHIISKYGVQHITRCGNSPLGVPLGVPRIAS
jgi:hypothetical protein